MNRIFRILSLLFTVGYINAQSPVVFGIIKDLDSGEGIEYATILQTGTKNAVESDLNGLYKINIPANTLIKLKVVRVGYEDVEVSIAPMYTGQKRNINVEMASKNTGMEIYVRAGKIEDVGMVREEVTELKILPSASGNFESILPHIALGVNAGAGGELTSQYSVRGGNYDENLIYVNDFEIFRPQLIRSGQQEGLSFPNIDLIRNLEFSSGGFESKYGDKMSSVLDIRYKIPTDFRGSATAS
ncbi:MAG TPA: carboxypeptidase-like regulatory domain-containing protein, partial [Saprospiraceae bacterium]|nr:carboxypeptidase-like regulatory domain-containing protein [Saprospiraceae bacterium]